MQKIHNKQNIKICQKDEISITDFFFAWTLLWLHTTLGQEPTARFWKGEWRGPGGVWGGTTHGLIAAWGGEHLEAPRTGGPLA